MDLYIQSCGFQQFIEDFSEAYNKELRWEVYLHKVWDKTFNEFEEGITEEIERIETSHMSEPEQETIILDSMSILQSFQPSEQEVTNGFI